MTNIGELICATAISLFSLWFVYKISKERDERD